MGVADGARHGDLGAKIQASAVETGQNFKGATKNKLLRVRNQIVKIFEVIQPRRWTGNYYLCADNFRRPGSKSPRRWRALFAHMSTEHLLKIIYLSGLTPLENKQSKADLLRVCASPKFHATLYVLDCGPKQCIDNIYTLVYIFNMNSKLYNKRNSCTETPIKRGEQALPAAQYFTKHAQQLQPKTMINIDLTNKQNCNPNAQAYYSRDPRLDQQEVSPKRKIIHLKSVTKNSKSRKEGSSSNNKKYSMEHSFTEVADFMDGTPGKKPSLVIEVDLKKHRRSIQDTLVSSSGLNEQSTRSDMASCCKHNGKKATYMVKGQPHCDKCAVKEITKGLLAVKIKDQRSRPGHQSFELNKNYKVRHDRKQQRSEKLSNFIEQLDKIEPSLEGLHENIDLYLSWITEYCCSESQKFEFNWERMMQYLGQVKKRVLADMLAHCERNCQVLNQAKAKIREEIENLSFMRNDIITNISHIVDENKVTEVKFQEVISDFTSTLRAINETSSRIKNEKCTIPKIEFDLAKLNDEINRHTRIHLVTEHMHLQAGQGSARKGQGGTGKGSDLLEDPYRMSFGKEMEKVQSPTFKVI